MFVFFLFLRKLINSMYVYTYKRYSMAYILLVDVTMECTYPPKGCHKIMDLS